MLQKLNKKYIIIFLGIAINVLYINSVFADTANRWWSEKEIPTLNVVKDLPQGNGRIWYVDAKNGDDKTGDGTSLKTPFKTIGKVVGQLKPGDTLVIGAGIYRERFWIRCKGASDNRILIGPRGNGEVIIDASEKVDGWTKHKGNIYKAPCSFKPIAVVADEKPLFPEFSLNKVNEGKWYYDKESQTLYLNIHGGGNPSLHDIGVIFDDKSQNAIFLNHAEYVTLYGLTIKYAGGKGIEILGSNNRIEKCNIKFNGNNGVGMFSYGNTYSEKTEIIKNHIYHNFIRNWPRGRYKKGGWGVGASGSNSPNTKFLGNVVHNNGGEGLSATGTGTVFRDNIVYDNWSVNIYVCNESDTVIDGNLIFCHTPNANDLYNNGDDNPRDGKNFRRLRAEGIMTSDEYSPATFKNIKIINNIIMGCRRGITHYPGSKDSGLKNVLIANNTIILPGTEGFDEKFIGIRIPYNNGYNENAVYRNNIVYASHPDSYLLYISTDPFRKNDDFHGLTFDHNIWYHVSNPEPFHVGSTWHRSFDIDYKVWAMKCKSAGQGVGSMFCDPKLFDVTRFSSDAAKLMPESPAIGKGIPIKEAFIDYYGNTRADNPDMGAIEHE